MAAKYLIKRGNFGPAWMRPNWRPNISPGKPSVLEIAPRHLTTQQFVWIRHIVEGIGTDGKSCRIASATFVIAHKVN